MLPTTKLELAIAVYKKLRGPTYEFGRITGFLHADVFQVMVEELEKHELLERHEAASGLVVFQPPSEINCFFAFSLEDLLSGNQRRQSVPDKFYIADQDYLYEGDASAAPSDIKGYVAAVTLVKVFAPPFSDHIVTKGNPKVIFFHGERFELALSYSESDLCRLSGVDEFVKGFINSDAHVEQKKTIVKSVLLEMSKEIPSNNLYLGFVMARFEEFVRRVSSSYQLYVSEFSFQKVKAEVEKSKFEALAKINKVFSDIQNQLLAVPAALIVVCGQMDALNTLPLKNLFILLGSFVFTVFMFFLILNQKNTLRTIFSEIKAEWNLIKGNHKAVKVKFDEPYKLLRKRYRYQYVMLEVVAFLVLLSFFITLGVYFYYDEGGVILGGAVAWSSIFLVCYVVFRTIDAFMDSSLRESDEL